MENAPGTSKSSATDADDEDGAGPSMASTSAAASKAPEKGSGLSSREARKARRDRMKDAKEEARQRKHQQQTKNDDPKSAAPGPEGGLPAVYVAYHDWEHYSSIRNLTGPHQGIPTIVEKQPPEEMALAENPPVPLAKSLPSSQASTTRRSPHLKSTTKIEDIRSPSPAPTKSTTTRSMRSSSASSSALLDQEFESGTGAQPRTRRSPKRSFDESEEGGGRRGLGVGVSEGRVKGMVGDVVRKEAEEQEEEDDEDERAEKEYLLCSYHRVYLHRS